MEVGLKRESPITYSNGKRLFTIDQKVDALVRIKMTGCSKAEVARSLHVAESTFRGWFKNKDIVMKAEAKYNEMKNKSSSASSDGYKSDENSVKSFSVDGSDNNSSTCYTDDRDGCSPSRFGSPDPAAVPVRRSPERLHHHHRAEIHHLHHHNKQKLKKQHSLNNAAAAIIGNSINNNNNNNNIVSQNNNKNLQHGNNNVVAAAVGGGGGGGLINVAGLNAAAAAAASLNAAAAAAGLGHQLNQQQQLQHLHLSQLAHHPLHPNLSSLGGGLKGTNAAAAAVAAAAAAAAAVSSAEHSNLRLTTAEFQSKINNFFSAQSPLLVSVEHFFLKTV